MKERKLKKNWNYLSEYYRFKNGFFSDKELDSLFYKSNSLASVCARINKSHLTIPKVCRRKFCSAKRIISRALAELIIISAIDSQRNTSAVFAEHELNGAWTFCTKVLLVILKIARIFISLAISIRGHCGCYFYAVSIATLGNIGIHFYCTKIYIYKWN